MKTKHTPGPWEIESFTSNGNKYYSVYLNKPPVSIASTLTPNMEGTRAFDAAMQANIKLIAAAPDLLAACEKVITEHDCFRLDVLYKREKPCDCIVCTCQAALNKAKGGA